MTQTAKVLSFFHRSNGADWSQAELAEFYRVEGALVQAGMPIATDRGVTDEGEPWFVFCRQDNEEIVAHFARMDGEYVVVSNLAPGVKRGRNLHAVIREIIDAAPYVLPRLRSGRQTIYLHPAAVLGALVATAFIKSAEMHDDYDAVRSENSSWWSLRHEFAILTAAATAIAGLGGIAGLDGNDKLSMFDHNFIDLAGLQYAENAPAEILRQDHAASESVSTTGPDTQSFRNAPDLTNWTDHNADNHDDPGVAKTAAVAVSPTKILLTDSGSFAGRPNHDDGTAAVGTQLEGTHSEPDAGSFSDATTNAFGHAFVGFNNNQSGSLGSMDPAYHSPQSVTSSNSGIGAIATTFDALQVAASDVHLDHSAFQPVVLAATSLQDAVQITISKVGFDSAVLTSATHSSTAHSEGATVSEAATNSVQLPEVAATGAVQLPEVAATGAVQLPEVAATGAVQLPEVAATGAVQLPEVAATGAVQLPAFTASPPNFDKSALQTLEGFFRDTSDVKVETFGADMLIVGGDASHLSTADVSIETWKMADGSTLSILGIVPHHAEAHAA